MITSKSNDFIKSCIQIKDKKYSKKLNKCLVESYKLVKELYLIGLVDTVILSENKLDLKNQFSNVKIEILSSNMINYITDTVNSDGVLALCNIPNSKIKNLNKCLVLDKIQDPTNLGAIIRSACAFGFDTIFTIDSVYPYSYKSIRSSMGQVFKLNIIEVDYNTLIEYKKIHNLIFYVADMDGENLDNIRVNNSENKAIIIGNEGNGVSDELLAQADKVISIPMKNCVESLNASVSAGIIMYILK